MQRFKAVLFDLDDTLYPAIMFQHSGYQAAVAYIQKVFGWKIPPPAHPAGHPTDLCADLLRRHFPNADQLLHQRVRAVFHYHKPNLELYPDARLALALLQTRGIPAGLVADHYGQVQRNKVKALQLDLLMDAFLFSDDLGGEQFWRPSAEPFHVMAAQMGCDTSEFIFVGDDAALDFIAPRSLGMGTVQIARRHNGIAPAAAEAPEHAAHIRIPSLDMLWDAIQMLERSGMPAAAGSTAGVLQAGTDDT